MVRSLLVRFENLNAQFFEPLLNEPTINEHIAVMSRPCSWGTHIEILAAASLFQVPVYEYVQTQDHISDHWEVNYPLAPAETFNQVPVAGFLTLPSHFELCYKVNSHYDCVVDVVSKQVCYSSQTGPYSCCRD